jgi:sulfur-oxidizing protein SoxX
MNRRIGVAVMAGLLLPVAAAAAAAADRLVVDDGIPRPLTEAPGDAVRGQALVGNRQEGLCLLCHSGPFPDQRSQGDLAGDLQGAGSRWTAAQLRLRVADARRLAPDGLMPSLHRTEGLNQVGAPWRGKPALSAQQVEDIVAYLQTLR